MILHLFRRTPQDDSIASLYGTIVAQARAPAFYQSYGVPDTVNGRLEMIMLHAVLVLGRLEGEAEPLRRLGQAVFDAFCRGPQVVIGSLQINGPCPRSRCISPHVMTSEPAATIWTQPNAPAPAS